MKTYEVRLKQTIIVRKRVTAEDEDDAESKALDSFYKGNTDDDIWAEEFLDVTDIEEEE